MRNKGSKEPQETCATKKALESGGPSFINVLAACPRGWRAEPEIGIRLGKVAVDTCVWPIYEVDDGQWILNSKPREKKPVTEWLELQGRFSHLMRPGREEEVARIQKQIDLLWESLLIRCK